MYRLFCVLFILFLIFNAYSAENNNYWYNNKIENTKIFLYEKGVGNSKDEAINDALNKIYRTFMAYNDLYEINFDYIFYNNEYAHNLYNELNNDIDLYTIEKIDYYNNKYYVLLSIKRKELVDYYTKELDYVNAKIELFFDKLKNDNIIANFSIKNLLKIYLNNAKKLTIILYNLDKINTKKYWNEYEKIEKYMNYHIYSVDLKSNNNDKFLFVENNIKDILLSENVKIDNYSDNMLLVNIINNRKKIGNYYTVDFGISLYLKHNGRNINYKYINFIEKSDKNYNEVYETLKCKINEFFEKNNTLILLFK